MKDEPPNGYRKKNNCPYCGYFCDAAVNHEDETLVPSPGDFTFCLMCCNLAKFNKRMNLVKFDIESVKNKEEKHRLKDIQKKMLLFWEAHPEMKEERMMKCKNYQH